MTGNALRSFTLLAMAFAAFNANATVQGTPTTVITNLRIEGSYGFIGYADAMPNCASRVWVDMTTPLGRAIYGTAMLAFSTGKSVVVRADDASTRVFGACGLYDIYVTQ